ncbi:signal transduction histidine kinase [Roseivivax marinus]|uniref:histidine kinase n=1 Tax=Roseivivax marinus TaxID=1379903 RepID=W4HFP1_9RHOB|nr:histidine kinase dimerization/phosphoacceptor domain -containing protein [Roseivivax marinus]ETW10951.1 signal transduction histidine kinase [Roseivivax marinus]
METRIEDLAPLGEIDPTEIVNSIADPLLVLTETLTVEYANDRFFDVFAVSDRDTIGRRIDRLGNGQWNIPDLIVPLERILENGASVANFEVDHAFEGIGRRVMRVSARKTVRPGNGSRRILVVIEDVTSEYDAWYALQHQKALSDGIIDTLREPLLVLRGDLVVISASREFYATFEVREEQTLGERLDNLGDGQWQIPDLLNLLTDVIPHDTAVEDFEVNHDFPAIGPRTILLNARRIPSRIGGPDTILLALQDVTHQRKLEAEREAALEQSRQLLEELNHRVMNSLTMIGSIIALEARRLSDEECQAALRRMRSRIDAVAALYSNLSKAHSIDTVDASDYLSALVSDIVTASGRDAQITLDFDIARAELSTRTAVPLGLIVNEVVTNSMKYAFRDRDSGLLGLRLDREEGTLRIRIWDDGGGIDPNARVDSGLGQKLTEAFSAQLDGTLERESNASGTSYTITIPEHAAHS